MGRFSVSHPTRGTQSWQTVGHGRQTQIDALGLMEPMEDDEPEVMGGSDDDADDEEVAAAVEQGATQDDDDEGDVPTNHLSLTHPCAVSFCCIVSLATFNQLASVICFLLALLFALIAGDGPEHPPSAANPQAGGEQAKPKKQTGPPCIKNSPERQRALMEMLTCDGKTPFHGNGDGSEPCTWADFRKTPRGRGGKDWWWCIYKHWAHVDPTIAIKDMEHPMVKAKGVKFAAAINISGKVGEIKKKWELAIESKSGTPQSRASLNAETWLKARNLYQLCADYWPDKNGARKRTAEGANGDRERPFTQRASAHDAGSSADTFGSSRQGGSKQKKARAGSTPSPGAAAGGAAGQAAEGRHDSPDPTQTQTDSGGGKKPSTVEQVAGMLPVFSGLATTLQKEVTAAQADRVNTMHLLTFMTNMIATQWNMPQYTGPPPPAPPPASAAPGAAGPSGHAPGGSASGAGAPAAAGPSAAAPGGSTGGGAQAGPDEQADA